MEEKKHQPRILYPIKLSFKNEKEIKTIPEKPKVRKFVASTLALQKKVTKISLERQNIIGQKFILTKVRKSNKKGMSKCRKIFYFFIFKLLTK